MTDYHFPDITDRLTIHPTVYISPRAWINGTVTIGADSSVWPMVVIRGDEGVITIGARCNIQDGSVLHADPHAYLTIGDDVSIGHAAIVHGATIEDEVLIGMGAVVLNGAHIGRGSLIAARALVTEGMVVPPGSLVKGIPGTISPLRPELLERVRRTARNYVELKSLYLARDRGA
ncbi:MAG: gamma carbonic anhydrase family protein [Herpetosiphonaceae bacterium]|nr:MAG: gamma carbonic anhydrase family protein [Herpetosiphonaceae bacterium]